MLSESALSESALSESALSEQARPPEASSAQPAADVRPELGASLSLADLERVRQALKLLSDEPAAASGQTAAPDDAPVSPPLAATPPAVVNAEGSDDDADTTPLPVILPGATEVPRPQDPETLRGPFEPARAAPSADTAVPAPQAAAVAAAEAAAVSANADPAEPADKLSAAAAEKLAQIKDLLITAEAIGEANLDRHFDRVSQRQRELIREFFERAIPGREPES